MKTVVCMSNIHTGEFTLFKSLNSLFENVSGIRCYISNREKIATLEWAKSELAENGVVSIHITKEAFTFCGLDFPAEETKYSISLIEVK